MVERVDFYLLEGQATQGKLRLACRLAQKAYQRGMRVHVVGADGNQASELDDLLWAFSQGSFVPHALTADALGAPEDYPVTIGDGPLPAWATGVLIQLAAEVPPGFDRFDRVIEPVDDDEADRAAARTRYRSYRDQGLAIDTHRVRV